MERVRLLMRTQPGIGYCRLDSESKRVIDVEPTIVEEEGSRKMDRSFCSRELQWFLQIAGKLDTTCTKSDTDA